MVYLSYGLLVDGLPWLRIVSGWFTLVTDS